MKLRSAQDKWNILNILNYFFRIGHSNRGNFRIYHFFLGLTVSELPKDQDSVGAPCFIQWVRLSETPDMQMSASRRPPGTYCRLLFLDCIDIIGLCLPVGSKQVRYRTEYILCKRWIAIYWLEEKKSYREIKWTRNSPSVLCIVCRNWRRSSKNLSLINLTWVKFATINDIDQKLYWNLLYFLDEIT